MRAGAGQCKTAPKVGIEYEDFDEVCMCASIRVHAAHTFAHELNTREARVRARTHTHAHMQKCKNAQMVSPVDNFYNFAIGGWRQRYHRQCQSVFGLP